MAIIYLKLQKRQPGMLPLAIEYSIDKCKLTFKETEKAKADIILIDNKISEYPIYVSSRPYVLKSNVPFKLEKAVTMVVLNTCSIKTWALKVVFTSKGTYTAILRMPKVNSLNNRHSNCCQ